MNNRQFARHKCEPIYKATKSISVVEIIDLTRKHGKKELMAVGLDGVDYMIRIEKPLAIPIVSQKSASNGLSQQKQPDEDDTEPFQNTLRTYTFLSSLQVQKQARLTS